MSRWFRFYDEAVNDPKVQRLPGEKFKAWVNLLCLASKNGGILPSLSDISYILRLSEEKVSALLNEFCAAGVIDPIEVEGGPMSYEPHNWKERQYKSDVSTTRVKRFRQRERNVSETPPEQKQITEPEQRQKDSTAIAVGAEAPDHRKRLFNEGLAKLASLTGKGPDACRSFVAKCLKAAQDDAVTVLGLIEDAERNQVVDPSAWIAARLKTGDSSNGKRSEIIAAADTIVGYFDRGGTRGGADYGAGGPTDPANARLLPSRRG